MKNESLKKENTSKFSKHEKILFLLYFFVICSITLGLLYLFGFVPEELKMSFGRYPENNTTKIIEKESGEMPLKILIPSIGVDAQVYNPNSTSTEILDSYLAKGAVHYPGSGLLGYGNIFIFGHNTRLTVVNNQAYKTFNDLNNLKAGDLIYMYSEKGEYLYKVSSVKKEDAEKALVQFDTNSHKLTLSTCNTFGAKSERYVVEANFSFKKTINN